jgi:hypothetical protein
VAAAYSASAVYMSGSYPERLQYSEAALLFALLPLFGISPYSLLNIMIIIIIRAFRHDTYSRMNTVACRAVAIQRQRDGRIY